MQRLVNDLLSLSRVEESEFQLPNEKVDLFTCLESAIDAINVIADKKKINIKKVVGVVETGLFINMANSVIIGNNDGSFKLIERKG